MLIENMNDALISQLDLCGILWPKQVFNLAIFGLKVSGEGCTGQ
jgi:hypothetical protein